MSAPTETALHDFEHLLRAFHFDALDAARSRDLHRSAHQHNFGTGFARRLRDCVAHLAGAAIADEAHGIDGLARRSGGDDDLQAVQRTRSAARSENLIGDLRGLDHAPDADFAACLLAARRARACERRAP